MSQSPVWLITIFHISDTRTMGSSFCPCSLIALSVIVNQKVYSASFLCTSLQIFVPLQQTARLVCPTTKRMKRASNVQLGLTSLFKAKQSVFHVLQTSPQLLMEQWRKKTALVKFPYSLFLSHSNHLITFATTLSQLVNSWYVLLFPSWLSSWFVQHTEQNVLCMSAWNLSTFSGSAVLHSLW